MTVDILSLCVGGGGVLALQIAWKLRRRCRTSMARWTADPAQPAQYQFLSVEVVATFDGLRFRKVGTDQWMWTASDGSGNRHHTWETSNWSGKRMGTHYHLLTFKPHHIEAARAHADELEAKLVSDMHWAAHREDLDRQRAAFVEGVVA